MFPESPNCDFRLPGGELIPAAMLSGLDPFSRTVEPVLRNLRMERARFVITQANFNVYHLFVDTRQVPSGRVWWVQWASCFHTNGNAFSLSLHLCPPEKVYNGPRPDNPATAVVLNIPDDLGIQIAPSLDNSAVFGQQAGRGIRANRSFFIPQGWFVRGIIAGAIAWGANIGTAIEVTLEYAEMPDDFTCFPKVSGYATEDAF